MKATEAQLLAFLKKSPQFAIPIYQRTYSWNIQECKQLWDDILRAGANPKVNAHFIGSIVYIEESLYHVSSPSALLVIDGQQRLTTISLLLEALARLIGEEEPVDGFSSEKIRSYYLLNKLEKNERAFKVLLTQTDKQTLLAIVQQKAPPKESSIRVTENFNFFLDCVKSLGNNLDALCNGLAKLMIVDVALSRGQDNPQLIFESMNSTGRELSQADLIRNYVLMGLELELQTRLYEEQWRPMELLFGQMAYEEHFDGFVRYYLTIKTGQIPNIRQVYQQFKIYAQSADIRALGVEELLKDLHAFAGYYCAMALGKETDKELADGFKDIRELKVDVAFPLLLDLYHEYRKGTLSKDDFVGAIRLVETYVFRRAVCGIPTNSMNKTFAALPKFARKDRYLESAQAYLIQLPSYRRFPSDEEFELELQFRNLYEIRNRAYWLRRMENFGRKERVQVEEYTIEHILPQCDNDPTKVPKPWKDELGPEWQRVWETYRHTLGNLTLTGYNSEYSNRPFREKRDMKGGFKESPLRLNAGLGTLETWNEKAIRERAKRLANEAQQVWRYPTMTEEQLAEFSPRKEQATAYSVDSHPHLSHGKPMRPVFEELRKLILAIDPCVIEEYLKLYVAYKAETNFVDVIPQAKQLKLSLNLKYHELDDPRGIAEDVTGIGRWGNGDVQVPLSSASELPYVMTLVRQAFDKQIENGGGQ